MTSPLLDLDLVVPTLLVVAAFFIGSFPTGVMLARARGIDLRQVGSGNIGATNVGRALGKRWAVVVLLVDALKGCGPVVLARQTSQGPWIWAAVGLAAILGHSFSVFLRGRGGKGVATSLGAALALAPLPALGSFALYAALYLIFRISSIGSLSAVCAFPVFLWLLGPRHPALFAFGLATALLVIVRHKDNLKRLARGQELKA
jgi:acyl phosphate:glycerol-3-phosphate acyltransferase